jgi:hypothetical protein
MDLPSGNPSVLSPADGLSPTNPSYITSDFISRTAAVMPTIKARATML